MVAIMNIDNIGNDDKTNYENMSINELDYHSNMVVVGRNTEIMSNKGSTL